MITLFIFYAHTVAAVALFTKRWQDGDLKEGLLAVTFLLLIFSVGWSISTVIVKFFIDEKGFGPWMDRDTMSLMLLAIFEAIFYYLQTRHKKRKLAQNV